MKACVHCGDTEDTYQYNQVLVFCVALYPCMKRAEQQAIDLETSDDWYAAEVARMKERAPA